MDDFVQNSGSNIGSYFYNIFNGSSKEMEGLLQNTSNILIEYLKNSTNSKINNVSPYHEPDTLLQEWLQDFNNGAKEGNVFLSIIEKFMQQSILMHDPRYMGHMNAVSLPITAICDLVTSLLNSDNGIFEQSSVGTVMEKIVIDWMCKSIGYDNNSGGFITSGGSLGNLTCLLAARQLRSGVDDIWKNGIPHNKQLAIMVSDQSHYCARRAAQIMGLGEHGVIIIKSDSNFHISKQEIEKSNLQAKQDNKHVFAIVGSACNTAPGTFENLDIIADFAEKYNIWFHADCAHGGTAILSAKYKYLLNGVHRADSVVWDLHKTMMMSGLATAILFKSHKDSYEAVKQDAPYLYKNSESESDDWYTLSKRSMECTKPTMSLKLYMTLKVYGQEIFEKYIDTTFDTARQFAEILKSEKYAQYFELGLEPESNIICFRYKNLDNNGQKMIKESILKSGNFCIVQTTFEQNKVFLRTVIMNPMTNEVHITELLDNIIQTACTLI